VVLNNIVHVYNPLAQGAKAYMLMQTSPAVQVKVLAKQIPPQERKVVKLFKGICGRASESASMADEHCWFQQHASEMKARMGSSRVQVTLESLQEALCRKAAWKASWIQ
jgi:hypothetical protein